ncbi:hypothetical protein TA3x_000799 [Tundrisphaera sp. TA3]|uniref:hypothetical protein n=1 Tax=Tundrisphaera sp. TA3 TaxID=3435775 RepID=UPI003EB8099C
MATPPARLLNLGAVLGILLVLGGCANPGPIASRQGMMGTLKTSVAQLEGDNQTLRREIAQLKAENTRIEDRLVQEEAANGEMAARLDDAKELITRQGGDTTALGRASRSSLDDDIPPPVKTINNSRRRQPPAASIPRPSTSRPSEDILDLGPPTRRGDRDRDRERDLGPQGRRDEPEDGRWLPVARGKAASTARVR